MPAKHICPYATATQTYLVRCEDPEGCHNMLGRVRVPGLSSHKINKRLEGDDSSAVGVHNYHYTGKLHLPLRNAWMENEQCVQCMSNMMLSPIHM